MSFVHDLGGTRGFWEVEIDPEEDHGFHEGWEARVFGLSRVIRGNGVCTTDEFRHAVERLGPATYMSTSYYERWLMAAEKIAIEKGVLEAGDVNRFLAELPDEHADEHDAHDHANHGDH